MMLTLALGLKLALSARANARRSLFRGTRALPERQVMKIHGLKDFFDAKIVYFIQIYGNFLS
jgi:hypothetical protein